MLSKTISNLVGNQFSGFPTGSISYIAGYAGTGKSYFLNDIIIEESPDEKLSNYWFMLYSDKKDPKRYFKEIGHLQVDNE